MGFASMNPPAKLYGKADGGESTVFFGNIPFNCTAEE